MFKKVSIIVLFITGIIILACLFERNSYCEYQPLIFDGNHYKTQISHHNVEFNNRLKKVLKYYHEDFKISGNGQILIKKSLFSDKELLNNYTKKALDKDWLPES